MKYPLILIALGLTGLYSEVVVWHFWWLLVITVPATIYWGSQIRNWNK